MSDDTAQEEDRRNKLMQAMLIEAGIELQCAATMLVQAGSDHPVDRNAMRGAAMNAGPTVERAAQMLLACTKGVR